MKSFSLTTSQLGKQLFYYDSCDSTNRIAVKLVQSGKARHGALVFSEFQTQGRGQQEKTWESSPGDNLTFSLILFPDLAVADFFRLNVLVSLAVAEALNHWVKDPIRIKWPNDIFYHHQKLGGILIQNNLQGTLIRSSVVGIGLNVNQLHFDHPRAISSEKFNPLPISLKSTENKALYTSRKQFLSNNNLPVSTQFVFQLRSELSNSNWFNMTSFFLYRKCPWTRKICFTSCW